MTDTPMLGVGFPSPVPSLSAHLPKVAYFEGVNWNLTDSRDSPTEPSPLALIFPVFVFVFFWGGVSL